MHHRSHAKLSVGWLLAALAWFSVTSLAHLEISLWLVRPRVGSTGSFAFKDFAVEAAIVGGVGLAVWLTYQARKAVRPWPVLALWALLALCVGLVDRFLTFSAAEYAHYPQYALLAWLLARALDPTRTRYVPGRVLFWTSLLGAADEIAQYLWITTSYSEYLDFNDILVNMLGAAAGILLYYGFEPNAAPRVRNHPRLEIITALTLAFAIGFGLQQQRIMLKTTVKLAHGPVVREHDNTAQLRLYLQRTVPGRHGSHNKGPYRGTHWILDPASGVALTLGGGALFCLLAGVAYRPIASTTRRKAAAALPPAHLLPDGERSR